MVTPFLPGPAELVLFATAVFLLNATPGVDFLLTVTRTLAGGVRAGAAAAVGINLGCVLHALAAAFGLAALLVVHPTAFVALQWAGAAYLAWLALGMLRHALWPASQKRTGAAADHAPAAGPGAWADLRRGLLTNVLNPKVALFFLAFLPQFVPASSADKTVSFLFLGAWFVAQSLLFSLGLVGLAATLRQVRTPAWLARVLEAMAGGLFIALAIRLLRERPVEVA